MRQPMPYQAGMNMQRLGRPSSYGTGCCNTSDRLQRAKIQLPLTVDTVVLKLWRVGIPELHPEERNICLEHSTDL